jgi:hypothetical protein
MKLFVNNGKNRLSRLRRSAGRFGLVFRDGVFQRIPGITIPGLSRLRRRFARNIKIGWANENRVNTTYGSEREIIYDSDGRYFRKLIGPIIKFS